MDSISIDTVICPSCDTELPASSEACHKCGSPTRTASPSSNSAVAAPQSFLHRPWVIAILLLHVGFLGIPLYCSLPYSRMVRLTIVVVSIVYTLFAVFVIGFFAMRIWSAVQSL